MEEMNKKHMGMHMKHKGAMMVVLGALILLNVYWLELTWGAFVGGILVLGGLAKMIFMGKYKKK